MSEHVDGLLEAYALDALDDGERAEVERHLAECPQCRNESQELAEAAHALPLALAAASPKRLPPFLKARVLAAVDPPRRRVGWLRPSLAGLAAVSAVAAALLVWNLELNDELSEERTLREQLAGLVGQQELVLEVVDSPRTRRAVLRAAAAGSPAYGKLFTRPDLPYAVVMVARLPQPRPGRHYEVTLVRNGRPEPAGRIAVNAEGFGVLVVETETAGPRYEAARVVDRLDWPPTAEGRDVLLWDAAA